MVVLNIEKGGGLGMTTEQEASMESDTDRLIGS
jgi:hypothetical protein